MMAEREQTVYQDLEGELVKLVRGQDTLYAKRLSLETAWHVGDPGDLQTLEWVQTVEQDFSQRTMLIYYHPLAIPRNSQQVRQMLRLEGPLAAWRFARLATDICHVLESCQELGIPQILIIPERIGTFGSQFILLPTLAGVLPPFSIWFSQPKARLMPYLAPEILRTRAVQADLFSCGTVYSLGQMLLTLITDSSMDSMNDDYYRLAEAFVETGSLNRSREWPQELNTFRSLIEKMCAFFPGERPDLTEVTQEFHTLLRKHDYKKIINDAIAEKRIGDAKNYVKDLQESQVYPVYICSQAEIYKFNAKIALAEPSPDYQRTIDQLSKAISFEPQNALLHLEVARVYKQFTAHSQYLILAESAYAMATELSGWQPELLEEWLVVLRQLPAKKWIAQTMRIPWDKRTESIFMLRATGLLELKQYGKAWDECADYFERFMFNHAVYEIAQKAAENISPLDLITWKHQRPGAEKLYASLAIVWERNGNMELASECFARALGFWHESE